MRRRRRSLRPIKFTLRFYPGQDDDLIHLLDELEEEHIGAKTQAMKEALRRSIGTESALGGVEGPLQASVAAPALDLAEVRQVVEAAVASALGRLACTLQGEGQVVGISTTTEEDDEVDDLLDALEGALVLGEDE